MNITREEAEKALAAIQVVTQKTRRYISSSGSYLFFILWGFIWFIGFMGSQFLSSETSGYIWMVIDTLGGILSAVIGIRMSWGLRSSSGIISGKRIGLFWLLLLAYIIAAIAISWPVSDMQLSMYIILFVMVGWLAMGLLLDFSSIWASLIITTLALIGYFLFPDIFHLWMAILGGVGMIGFGLYVRSRW